MPDTAATPFQRAAQAFADAFIVDTRPNGVDFYRLADGSPEWMRDAVREAHNGESPDDWRYSMCDSIVTRLAEIEDEWEAETGDIADSLTEHTNSALAQWLADNPSRATYCDDAVGELGCSADDGVFRLIQVGQYLCLSGMAETLLRAVNDAAGEYDTDADDDAEG